MLQVIGHEAARCRRRGVGRMPWPSRTWSVIVEGAELSVRSLGAIATWCSFITVTFDLSLYPMWSVVDAKNVPATGVTDLAARVACPASTLSLLAGRLCRGIDRVSRWQDVLRHGCCRSCGS